MHNNALRSYDSVRKENDNNALESLSKWTQIESFIVLLYPILMFKRSNGYNLCKKRKEKIKHV